MKKLWLLLPLLFSTPLLAFTWTSVGPGGGGSMYVPAISPLNPNLWFVSCDMGAVYRSTDAGGHWNFVNFRELMTSLDCAPAFHPTDPNILWDEDYRDFAYNLRRSTDGGVHWSAVGDIPSTPLQLFTLTEAPLVLLVAGGGDFPLQRSTTGTSFADVAGMTGVFRLAQNPGGVWAASATELWRSTTRAASFSAVTVPAAITADDPILDLAACSTAVFLLQMGSLWRSTNNGTSWSQVLIATVADRGDFTMVRGASNMAWVTSDDGGTYQTTAFVSTDNGANFAPTFFCNSSYSDVSNLSANWLSLDFSCGWGGMAYGFGICRTNPRIALWTDSGRSLATTDGGTSWHPVYTHYAGSGTPAVGGRWESIGLEVTSCWDILLSPWEPGFIRVAWTDIDGAHSTDNGLTWRVSAQADGIPYAWFNTNYDLEPDTGTGLLWGTFSGLHDIPEAWSQNYYSRTGSGGVLVSSDHGRTWTTSSSGLPDKPVTSIAVDYTSTPAARRLFAAVWSNGVWRSTNNGASWTRCPTGMDVGDGTNTTTGPNTHVDEVQVHPTGTVFALKTKYIRDGSRIKNDSGLWRSTDHGDSWTFISPNVADCLPVGGIDLAGEHSWADAKSFTVDPTNVNRIFVGAENCNNGKVQGGLYLTTNGGTAWTRVLEIYGAFRATLSRFHTGRVYLASTSNGVMISTDNGVTWAEDTAFPFACALRVTEDRTDSGTVWVTTFGGGAFKGRSIATGVGEQAVLAANAPRLDVVPNPVRDRAEIRVSGAAGTGRMELLGLDGRVVRVWPAGTATLDARDLVPGVYWLRMAGSVRRVVVVR